MKKFWSDEQGVTELQVWDTARMVWMMSWTGVEMWFKRKRNGSVEFSMKNYKVMTEWGKQFYAQDTQMILEKLKRWFEKGQRFREAEAGIYLQLVYHLTQAPIADDSLIHPSLHNPLARLRLKCRSLWMKRYDGLRKIPTSIHILATRTGIIIYRTGTLYPVHHRIGPEKKYARVGPEKKYARVGPEKTHTLQGKAININSPIKGTAYILTNFSNSHIPSNSILIVENARPEIIHHFSHCIAFISNEGGVLSHAALLAREYGISCIMGAMDATKKIKTGNKIKLFPSGKIKIIK